MLPDIQSVSPATVPQGHNTTLILTGKNLSRNLALKAGDGITFSEPLSATETTLTVTVTVEPQAQPGARTINLLYQDRILEGHARLVITAGMAAPAVRLLQPNAWEQGGQYDVILTGANLPDKLQLRFDQGIRVKTLTVDSATRAKVTLQVEPTARPGAHRLEIRTGNDDRWTPVTATAMVTLPPLVPPVLAPPHASALDTAPTPPGADTAQTPPQAPLAEPMTLQDLTPDTWPRGSTQKVTLRGMNLPADLQGRFDQSVSVTAWKVTSPTTATLTVAVSDTAAAGRHVLQTRTAQDIRWHNASLGGMVTVASHGPAPGPQIANATVAPAAAKSVAPTHQAPKTSLPSLSGMSPNRWYPGEKYTVSVYGNGFTQGMGMDLGTGITVSEVLVASAASASMTISVAPKTAPGTRQLRIRHNQEDPWAATNISGLIQQVYAPSTQPMAVQQPLDTMTFTKGKITLKTPEFGKFLLMENAVGDHGIPKTTDATRFTWKEETIGQSQWFELRIVDKKGQVRMKRTITGQPLPDLFYHPDANFIAQLFALFRPEQGTSGNSTQIEHLPAMHFSQLSGAKGQPTPPQNASLSGTPQSTSSIAVTSAGQYVAEHDQEIECFWEVAGLKQYSTQSAPPTEIQTGQSKSKPVVSTHDVEVAISERWPLQLPAFSPSGLACSKANTVLDYRKASNKPGEVVHDETIYVGDTVQVSGEIVLDESPWMLDYSMEWGKTTGTNINSSNYTTSLGSTPVQAWKFSNLFIDWGDGTYETVRAMPGKNTPQSATQTIGPPQTGLKVPPAGKIFIQHDHVYRYSNKFPVRIFVLPLEEVGTIGAIVSGSKAPEPPATTAKLNLQPPAVLVAAAKTSVSDAGAGLGKADMSVAKSAHLETFSPPGGKAFLLYCNPQIIDIKADPAAIGPLHLEQIEITEFSGQPDTNSTALTVTSASLAHQPGAATPDTSGAKRGQIGGIQGVEASAVQVKPQSSNPQTVSQAAAKFTPHVTTDAQVSSCDAAFFAKAKLTYYGQGSFILRWKVDGVVIEESTLHVGPSPIRTGLKDDNTYAQDIIRDHARYVSPSLPLEVAKNLVGHTVTVEAALAPGEKKYATYNHNVGGVNIPVHISDQLDHVVSEKTYAVVEPAPGEPCVFKFPVADGKHFVITGLKGRAAKTGSTWGGKGTLIFDLPDSPSGQSTRYVDISFQNWTVSDDSVVTAGQINVQNLGQTFDKLPGVSVTLQALHGSSGQELKATLDLKVKDNSFRVVESGGTQAPAWTGVTAPLVPESGWYADGKSLPLTQLGWSLCQLESTDVRLDLSRDQGTDPAPLTALKGLKLSALGGKPAAQKAPSQGMTPQTQPVVSDSPLLQPATAWVGVHFGEKAVLHPYLFHLADVTVPAKNWYLASSGVTGTSHSGHFSNVMGRGSIEFDGITITAGDNKVDAEYDNVRVKVPWPAITLSGGSAHLNYSLGQEHAEVGLQFDTANLSVQENYGKVVMQTKVKEFLHRASGWGIVTDTSFTFKDANNDVATVPFSDLFFSMDGVALFAQDATTHSMGLNAKTKVGEVEANLHSLQTATTTDPQSAERLRFTFKGDINFPALSSATVDVMYAITNQQGLTYKATGPKHSKFTTGVDYPPGRSMAESTIAPEIKDADSGVAGEHNLYASLDPILVADGSSGSGVHDTFSGSVDMKMFGMGDSAPGISFRYGSYNGAGYWLTHVNVSGLAIPIYAGIILYGINGGLAYGFSSDAYQSNPMTAIPNNPGKMVYTAGITVSSAEPDVIQLGGQLTVIPEDVVIRMGFGHVVLLGYDLGNSGGGYFEYGGGAFKGKVWGNLSLFGGAVAISAPQGAENDLGSSGLYFSTDDWQIYCGRPESPIKAHFLIADGMGFMHLGRHVGLKVGGGLDISTGKICLGVGAVEAHLNTLVGMNVTPSIHLTADFRSAAGVSVWVPSCSGEEFSFNQNLDIHAEAMPVHLTAGFTVDCGFLFGEYTFNVTLI